MIGSAMNDEEFKLWDSLINNLPKESLVKIVGSSLSGAQKVGEKFNKRGFNRVSPLDVAGFYQYTLCL